MKLKALLKMTAFATATMFFLSCSESENPADSGTPGSGKGVVEFSILGENITYNDLEFSQSLKSAKIDYAYMLVQNPTLMPTHEETRTASRHVGETFEGKWAVDLMDPNGIMNPEPDSKCTPTILGHLDVDAGSYESKPKITIPLGNDWDNIIGKSDEAKAKLEEHGVAFLFGGSLVDNKGNSYKFEIREPISKTIEIDEYPRDGHTDPGAKLVVPSDDTLRAVFHPHIDHALEVFDENSIDLSTLTQENGVIVISDEINTTVKDMYGETVDLYMDMVKHIIRGDHWDVNVIVIE